MKPYGNQHKFHGEFNGGLNSTKHGNLSSKNRKKTRRLANKTRRTQDKALIKGS